MTIINSSTKLKVGSLWLGTRITVSVYSDDWFQITSVEEFDYAKSVLEDYQPEGTFTENYQERNTMNFFRYQN